MVRKLKAEVENDEVNSDIRNVKVKTSIQEVD